MSSDYYVTVCDRCRRASCWHGEDLCEDAAGAGTLDVLASTLRAEGNENRDRFSRTTLARMGIEAKEPAHD